ERDPHFAESETPIYVGRGIAALAADPLHWTQSGNALASWDLSDQYGISDSDGRRPHWGRHIERAIDEEWEKLARLVHDAFVARNPWVTVAADRATLSLTAGDVTRKVLEPELFFTPLTAIRDELVGKYDRANASL